MTFRLRQLPEPLELEQVVLDPTWNWFKTVMVFLGGFCLMAWIIYLSFQVGSHYSVSPTPTPVPASYSAPAPPATTPVASSVQQSQWNSYADCQRHYVLTLGRDPEGACDFLK